MLLNSLSGVLLFISISPDLPANKRMNRYRIFHRHIRYYSSCVIALFYGLKFDNLHTPQCE